VQQLATFRRGAAHIALRSGCDPLPVVIQCDPPTLKKGARWYHVPDRTVKLTIEVGDPLRIPERIKALGNCPLAARALTTEIHEFYRTHLPAAESEYARA